MKVIRALIVLGIVGTVGTAAFASAAGMANAVPKLGSDVDAVASPSPVLGDTVSAG